MDRNEPGLTPTPGTTTAAADAFIPGAPDAAAATPEAPRRVRKGRKVQITLTIAEPLLDRVDKLAGRIWLCRGGWKDRPATLLLETLAVSPRSAASAWVEPSFFIPFVVFIPALQAIQAPFPSGQGLRSLLPSFFTGQSIPSMMVSSS